VPTPGRNAYELINAAGELPVTGSLTSLFRISARSVAGQAVQNLNALVTCAPAEPPTDCATRFIDDFVARAFRRPVSVEERARLISVFEVGARSSFAEGIRLVLEAVLQSGSFIYRAELGPAAAAPGETVGLTAFELASSLAFFLLNSIPDAELWSAAQDGSLVTAEVYAAQVERLLALPRVQQNLSRILVRWLKLERVLVSERATTSFPEFDALRQPMLDESHAFFAQLLSRGGNVSELFSSRQARIDARLAEFYGVATNGAQGLINVELPASQRAGILTQGSLIASVKASNRSVHRGLFILRELLCHEIPPPPVGLDTKPPNPEVDTEREFANYRASQGSCGACHGAIDGIGLSYERYDALGRYAATDASGLPIDASGSLLLDGAPVTFGDITELGQLLGKSPQVGACVSQKLLGYALGAAAEASCSSSQTRRAAANGASLVQVFRSILADSLFKLRKVSK